MSKNISKSPRSAFRSVLVNGETFRVCIAGMSLGDQLKGVGEQCDGCGNALDAEEPATLQARGNLVAECPCCQMTFPLQAVAS